MTLDRAPENPFLRKVWTALRPGLEADLLLTLNFVNQFVGVVQPNEIFLLLGSLMPPPIVGDTIEERKAQAVAVPFVAVKPIVRLGLTPERLKEMIGVLQQTMENYDLQNGRSQVFSDPTDAVRHLLQ